MLTSFILIPIYSMNSTNMNPKIPQTQLRTTQTKQYPKSNSTKYHPTQKILTPTHPTSHHTTLLNSQPLLSLKASANIISL